LETALLQHPARRRVSDARAGLQGDVLEVGEGVIDHGVQRLGGVAFAPMLYAQPVAELRCLLLRGHAAGADHRFVAQRDEKHGLAVAGVGSANKPVGIRDLVWVRNARRVLGNAAIVGERCYRFSVLEARGAHSKPLALEDGNTSFAKLLSW